MRETQRAEVADMLDEECLDFEPDAPATRHAPATAERDMDDGRADAETRRRFARTREVTDTDLHPRRLIIERDRRQGRPPGDTGPPR